MYDCTSVVNKMHVRWNKRRKIWRIQSSTFAGVNGCTISGTVCGNAAKSAASLRGQLRSINDFSGCRHFVLFALETMDAKTKLNHFIPISWQVGHCCLIFNLQFLKHYSHPIHNPVLQDLHVKMACNFIMYRTFTIYLSECTLFLVITGNQPIRQPRKDNKNWGWQKMCMRTSKCALHH